VQAPVITPSAASPFDLLLPAGLRIGYATRAWLRDSLPAASDSLDDLARMDRIYLQALVESEGDIGNALFGCLIACFEHRDIPLSFGVHIPLTFEPDSAFNRRVARLPSRLFADRPTGDDRDKLQHFFASAWLAWRLDNPAAADAIGLAVEAGEDLFVVGGADDPRDVRANRLGQLFAQLLITHPNALPGMMLRAWNRQYLARVGATRP
jgi:hypothetical protein